MICILLCCVACNKEGGNVDLDNTTPQTSDAAIMPDNIATNTPDATLNTDGQSPLATADALPTQNPVDTAYVTNTPALTPTQKLTAAPTKAPTNAPTKAPTKTSAPSTPTAVPTKAPTPKPTATPRAHVQITDEILKKIETGFLRLVNEERASVGCEPLTINLYLDSYAYTRSQEIVTLFSHTRPDGSDCFSGISSSSYPYSTLGENIAQNHHLTSNYVTEETRYFTGSDEQITTVYTNLFTAFKNSPGHYANMINSSFKECGIGITVKTNEGANVPYFYLAHIFGAQQ